MQTNTAIVYADPASLADRIGELDAALAPLLAEREQLAALIKAAGPGAYAGQLWTATVVESHQNRTDWRAVAEKLEPSRQLITAHTKSVSVVSLRVRGTK